MRKGFLSPIRLKEKNTGIVLPERKVLPLVSLPVQIRFIVATAVENLAPLHTGAGGFRMYTYFMLGGTSWRGREHPFLFIRRMREIEENQGKIFSGTQCHGNLENLRR